MSFDLGPNLTQIFLALVAIVPAIIAAYYARKAGLQAIEAKEVALDSVAKAVETHDLVNSRMSELLEMTRAASRAEGVIEGQSSPVSDVPQDVTIVNSDPVPVRNTNVNSPIDTP